MGADISVQETNLFFFICQKFYVWLNMEMNKPHKGYFMLILGAIKDKKNIFKVFF